MEVDSGATSACQRSLGGRAHGSHLWIWSFKERKKWKVKAIRPIFFSSFLGNDEPFLVSVTSSVKCWLWYAPRASAWTSLEGFLCLFFVYFLQGRGFDSVHLGPQLSGKRGSSDSALVSNNIRISAYERKSPLWNMLNIDVLSDSGASSFLGAVFFFILLFLWEFFFKTWMSTFKREKKSSTYWNSQGGLFHNLGGTRTQKPVSQKCQKSSFQYNLCAVMLLGN